MSEKKVRPFGLRDKIGYMMGDFGNDFMFIFASTYVMIFYTKVMGISTTLVGSMFVIARCVDAFTDIGMGRIVDSSVPGKNGRVRPWILRMVGPAAVMSFLMYQSFLVNASYGVRVAYMFVTYLLWGSVFYTAVNIPYGSLASVISDKPEERSSLSVFRSMGASFAGVIIMVIAPLVVYITDENGNQVATSRGFTIISAVFALCAIIAYGLCYAMTTERVEYVPKPKTERVSTGKTLTTLFTSRSLMTLILAAILLLLAGLLNQGINTYLYQDYFQDMKIYSMSSLVMFPAMFILAAVSTKMATRFGKKECSAVGMLMSGGIYVLMGFMHIRNPWFFIVMNFIGMLGYYFFNMQIWAIVTDVIDDMEVKSGSRDDGTVYGIYSFARKIGQALAGGLSGWALGWIGYDSLAVSQTDSVRSGIYSLATWIPGLIYLLCGVVLMFLYPLGKREVESNVAELKERHSGQPSR